MELPYLNGLCHHNVTLSAPLFWAIMSDNKTFMGKIRFGHLNKCY